MWLREHGIETLTDIAKIGDRRAQSFSLPALRILATSWSVLTQKPRWASLTKKMQCLFSVYFRGATKNKIRRGSHFCAPTIA